MSQRNLWTVAIFCLSMLAVPRPGSAGIGELIWEMSGPQMVGVTLECRARLDGTGWDSCKVAGFKVTGNDTKKIWLSVGGGVYFSTGKNAGGQDYEAGRVVMLVFDPMLEMQSVAKPRLEVYHGVMGMSYNLLMGCGFSRFTNVAFKVRPLGVVFPIGGKYGLDLAYNLRLYPNGFSPDEFGKLPVPTTDNKPEAVHGISIGFRKYL